MEGGGGGRGGGGVGEEGGGRIYMKCVESCATSWKDPAAV